MRTHHLLALGLFALVSWAGLAPSATAGAPSATPSHDPKPGQFQASGATARWSGILSEPAALALRTWLEGIAGVPAVLVLDGPGGDGYSAFLAVAAILEHGRVHTVVPAGRRCASFCSLVWSAGAQAEIEPGAGIVLHGTTCRGDPCRHARPGAVATFEVFQRVLLLRASPEAAALAEATAAYTLHEGAAVAIRRQADGSLAAEVVHAPLPSVLAAEDRGERQIGDPP